MTWKIVADSGCDYRQLPTLAIDTDFVSVPLTIQVADQVFIDDANLDINHMMETMYATSEASKSACPSPDD
ncbi:fatty acid-binding protein DegV, partial [Streptococcus pneumoniae]